ncbi:sigma-70 family RNA polymerase sigma factor [Halobacillus sp. A5]|uniref:sigma-70 family RNA polymerase sigma factor n=1 Tax=Halobacillus sp. A5 TaxID=2880263 RepID=UPI0020A6D54B|nr:sigma-70 family RNA polymerase sigma factor [Halobacillus sp. A5]MCP3029313.1 sigma-70 family RNA polymerase sigma factor [Halobacillus sp. A5]
MRWNRLIGKERTEKDTEEPKPSPTINEKVEEWIHFYSHDLKWLAYSYVKDHAAAEDLTQETFIKAYQKYASFKQESSEKTWLYKITINLCKDHLKSSYIRRVFKKGAEVFQNIPSQNETPEQHTVNKSEDEELLEHILKLEDKYREVIVLYYFEEFDVKELSDLLNVSPNTVKTRLRRGRQLLQEKLVSEGSTINE